MNTYCLLSARPAARRRFPLCRAAAAGIGLAFLLAGPHAVAADDGLQDAVGVPMADGSTAIYADPFCAGFAVAFEAGGGDGALVPECPEEPVEPLSMSPYRKGERAGKASAQSFVRFRKQQAARGPAAIGEYLPGFYDQSQDAWVSNQADLPRGVSFDNGKYAMIGKEGAGQGVIDQSGRIVVPLRYAKVGMDAGAAFFVVRDAARRVALYNPAGVQVVAPGYDDVRLIDSRHILAIGKGVFQVMDLDGKPLFSSTKEISSAGDGFFWFMEAPQRFGLLDSRGDVIVPAEFTYTSAFQNGKLTSQKADGENYLIDQRGKVVKQR